MEFVENILLTPAQTAFVGILAIYIVWAGRPEWSLGIFLSMMLWTRTVFIGPIVHTWFFMGVTLVAAVVYLYRNHTSIKTLLPPNKRWIVLWITLWCLWMLLLLQVYQARDKRIFLRDLFAFDIFPILIVLLFAPNIKRIKGFVLSFIATTIVGGWFDMSTLNITFDYLLRDPTLKNTHILRLNIPNYHWPAYSFAISLIMLIALFLQNRRWILGIPILLAAGYCIYFLFMIGSRQSLNGAGVVSLLFAVWSLTRKNMPKWGVVFLMVVGIGLSLLIYQSAPDLILRDDNTSYTSTLDAAGNRGWLWEIGWVNFLASPIWGWGFEKNVYSHNLFIGALADQGIVGFIFLLGVIVFFLRRSRGVWSGRGPANVAIWRAMFVCIGIFGLSHGLVSSDVFSEWHLYWSAAFLWWLGQGLENSDKGIVASDKITSLITRHSPLVTHHSAEEPTT